MALALVAVRKGRLKGLLVPYIAKNCVLIVIESVIFYYHWYERYENGEVKYHRLQFAAGLIFVFGLVVPCYSNFIVIMYLIELNEREEIARKLYVAWQKRMEVAEKAKHILEEQKKAREKAERKKKMMGITSKKGKGKGKDKGKKKKKK